MSSEGATVAQSLSSKERACHGWPRTEGPLLETGFADRALATNWREER